MKLAIDIDGCLAAFCPAYAELLVSVTGRDRFPKGWKQNPDLLYPVWDWELHYGYSRQDRNDAWSAIKSDPTFWEYLKSVDEDVVPTLTRLSVLNKRGHELYFLTNRVGRACKIQTERWLYSHGCDFSSCIIMPKHEDKLAMVEILGIDLLIDDRLATIEYIAERCHPSLRLYLKDAPYNREGRTGDYKVVGSVKEMLESEGLWKDQ